MSKGKRFLSDLKLHSDYLKWKPLLERYETWEEAQEHIIEGHRIKYKNDSLEPYLKSALESQNSKLVLASQRNLQYRPEQINRSNARIYNCSSTHLMRNKGFQEIFFLGLNGCGVGVSLLIPFVDNLSRIQKRKNGTKTFVIPDSVEGWSDALGVLMSSYFIDKQPFPEYAGYEIKFDFSLIRPKGAYISGGFKAPGAEGLKSSLYHVEQLLEKWIEKEGDKIRPILAFDIICHISDAVLSGGVRRSALNMIVDINDEEMIMAKTGNWFSENKQRDRSNNSVLLIRDEMTKEQFEKIVNLNDGMNDIGFVFGNSLFDMFNPCFTGDMKILTKNGYLPFDNIEESKLYTFINALGQEVEGYVKLTGYKKTVEVKLTTGKVITCTPDHVFMTLDGESEAKDLKGKQIAFFLNHHKNLNTDFIKYGFLQGDGGLGRLNSERHKGLEIFLNEKDKEIAKLFSIEPKMKTYINGYNKILSDLGFCSNKLPERNLPSSINTWVEKDVKSFLNGLWSANGSIIKNNRISFKTTCKKLVEELIVILNKYDIKAYYTTNKSKIVKFENGDYKCKENYDLNIANYESMLNFYNSIGFSQTYKNDALLDILKLKSPKVVSIKEQKGLKPIYDFELNDMTHWGVVEGVIAHNCFEILKLPIYIEGENIDLQSIKYKDLPDFINKYEQNFGVAFCNLTEINAEKCTTDQKFFKACKDASILGTLQAGYTSFPYLGEITEKIVEREALLGVSITGWMNNPRLFNEELLKKGAKIVKDINKEVSEIIGIKQAARTTCVKPSGNASVILETASGIHPEHSERYFRIMQLNKEAETAKWLEENMPFLLENSVWSPSKTDYVVFVPVENPKGGFYKSEMKGIKHLEMIKFVQTYWVSEGTNREICLYPNVNNNVSNTVIIDDKKEIVDYIWENRDLFTAVSFLSDSGDKDFNQAPFTSVLTFDEIIAQYGKGALFASGLIIDGLHYFNENLWEACDSVANKDMPVVGTREQVLLKKYWISRAKKFAKNYFNNDIQKTIYCLKNIHLLHKWEVINRQFKDVNFGKILKNPEFKDVADYGAQACSGVNGCEVTRI